MNVLSTDFPSPRSGACMVYIKGFLYIYGGKNSGGLMNELWKFNLKTKTYVLESQSADAFETNFCYVYNESIAVISSNTLKKVLFFYYLDSQTWSDCTSLTAGYGSADFIILNTVISIGGSAYLNLAKSSIVVYDFLLNTTKTYNAGFYYCHGAFTYFGSVFYLIGGKKILGRIVLPEPSDEFVAFDLLQIYTKNICSRGTVYDGSSCVSCK